MIKIAVGVLVSVPLRGVGMSAALSSRLRCWVVDEVAGYKSVDVKDVMEVASVRRQRCEAAMPGEDDALHG